MSFGEKMREKSAELKKNAYLCNKNNSYAL